jgi:hypothetical protein
MQSVQSVINLVVSTNDIPHTLTWNSDVTKLTSGLPCQREESGEKSDTKTSQALTKK